MPIAGSVISPTGVNGHPNAAALVLAAVPGISVTLAALQGSGALVVVKTLAANTQDLKASACSEVANWSRAVHPNILPLMGIQCSPTEIITISPWALNGTIAEYTVKNPGADRRKLITQIAEALAFMHDSLQLMHGNVDCENVLVSDAGDALLSNFGNSSAANELYLRSERLFMDATAFSDGMPPKTSALDVYAYGWFVFQVYTDISPQHIASDRDLVDRIVRGSIPTRPRLESPAVRRGLDDLLWNTCVECWGLDPVLRPRMSQIAWTLSAVARGVVMPRTFFGDNDDPYSGSQFGRAPPVFHCRPTCCAAGYHRVGNQNHCSTQTVGRGHGTAHLSMEHPVDNDHMLQVSGTIASLGGTTRPDVGHAPGPQIQEGGSQHIQIIKDPGGSFITYSQSQDGSRLNLKSQAFWIYKHRLSMSTWYLQLGWEVLRLRIKR
ncbi:kinase-like protein, partial [Exidia glandulosa HHB12029]